MSESFILADAHGSAPCGNGGIRLKGNTSGASRATRSAAALGVLALAALGGPVHATTWTTVYSNDFEGSAGPEWSATSVAQTPEGCTRCTRFLGELATETVCLTAEGLPAHALLRLSFDLFILKSWDGNGEEAVGSGPDLFSLSALPAGGECGPNLCSHLDLGVDDPVCQTLLPRTSFSNHQTQSYPSPWLPHGLPGHADNPPRTGSVESDTLGFSYWGIGNSIYRFTFTFPHASPDARLVFAGMQNQAAGDESWGLDNVVLEAA